MRRSQLSRRLFAARPPLAELALRADRLRSRLEVRRCRIEGVDYAYLEGGNGTPLVLIHGVGADKHHFARAARWLTPHYRVILPDLAGFGESTRLPPAAGYTVGDQAERLAAFIAQLAPGPVHLGGSSMGGWIALEYARRRGHDVASLWLVAPGGIETARPSEMLEAYARTGTCSLFAQTPADFDRVIDLVCAQRPFLPWFLRRALARRSVRDHDLHQEIFRALLTSPRLETIARALDVPARIHWGGLDRVLDVSGAHILEALMPRATLKIWPDLGHLPMLEKPRAAALDYLAFRRDLASR